MANIVDYVKYYGNKTFEEVAFNDVDALIFSQLSYVQLSDFLTKDIMPISISDLGKLYFEKVKPADMKGRMRLYRETYDLFNELKNTKRYSEILITNHKDVVDNEKQFGAITFRYLKKWVFVSFEGTDSSIIGWKEDFMMSHTFPVPSQKMAISYLEEEVRFLDKCVYVGGHSKGGNLSLVASMYSSSFVKHRLKKIYNFDGPGLREKEYHSVNYSKIKNKLNMFVPSESVIGMTLCHDFNYEVVKSNENGLWQHDAFSWECFGSVFIPDELSKKSITFSKTIKEFLEEISDEERKEFVEAIFDLLDKAGIKSTENVTLSKILKCITNVGDVTSNKKIREKLIQIFNIFIKLLGA